MSRGGSWSFPNCLHKCCSAAVVSCSLERQRQAVFQLPRCITAVQSTGGSAASSETAGAGSNSVDGGSAASSETQEQEACRR